MLKTLFTFVLIIYLLVFIANVLTFISIVIDAKNRVPKEDAKTFNPCKGIAGLFIMLIIYMIPIFNIFVLIHTFLHYDEIVKGAVKEARKNYDL